MDNSAFTVGQDVFLIVLDTVIDKIECEDCCGVGYFLNKNDKQIVCRNCDGLKYTEVLSSSGYVVKKCKLVEITDRFGSVGCVVDYYVDDVINHRYFTEPSSLFVTKEDAEKELAIRNDRTLHAVYDFARHTSV